MIIKRLLATSTVLVTALAPAALVVPDANAATARPACSDSYVVASTPLYNNSTHVSSWNYGYLQLWYDGCTGNNWGRLVSLVGSGPNDVVVYNPKGANNDGGGCDTNLSIVTTGTIHSPNDPAGTYGEIAVGNTTYTAETDQDGADHSDYPYIICQL